MCHWRLSVVSKSTAKSSFTEPSCPASVYDDTKEHHARSKLRQGEGQHIGGQDPADHLRPRSNSLAHPLVDGPQRLWTTWSEIGRTTLCVSKHIYIYITYIYICDVLKCNHVIVRVYIHIYLSLSHSRRVQQSKRRVKTTASLGKMGVSAAEVVNKLLHFSHPSAK